jgi:phage terminase large subunit-like protein
MINKSRRFNHPVLTRIAVGVDPQGGMVGETGIVVAGVSQDSNEVLHGYLLEDASISGSPATWASQAVAAYHKWEADVLVAERNFGGDMVEANINSVDPSVPVKVVTASRGKVARAQPISTLMEKDRIHHVGEFPKVEDEMCTYYQTRSKSQPSPNRYDAYVWAFSELMLEYCATEIGSIEIPMV